LKKLWSAKLMPDRIAQSRPSIFELQPLERRLFLTASPTITLSTSTPTEGAAVTFALASNDSDGEGIDHWLFDPGDGTGAQTLTGDRTSVTHTYSSGGHYTISGSVTESTTTDTGGGGGDTGDTGGTGGGSTGGGGTYSANSLFITVGPGPVVGVTAGFATENVSYSMGVSTSNDPADTDNDPVPTIGVDWGDSNSNTYHASDYGGTMPNPLSTSHTYTAAGAYSVNTTATDDDGVTGSLGNTLIVVPATPTGLTATAVSNSEVDLAWTDNSGSEDGYAVERSLDNSTWVHVTTLAANSTTFHDIGLTGGATYYYRVKATKSTSDGAYSSVAYATTSLDAPILTIDGVTSASVTMEWTPSNGAANYNVLRKKPSDGS
jgi:hypothetical protein